MPAPEVIKAMRAERARVALQAEKVRTLQKTLEGRLKALDAGISSIEPFYGPETENDIAGPFGKLPGITDAVRNVYHSNAGKYLSPIQIRDALKEEGMLKGYENNMAVIHQVVRRLEDRAEIEVHPTERKHRWLETNKGK